jgi:hypothetical protein
MESVKSLGGKAGGMSVMRRVALLCGIVGGAGGVLGSVGVLLLIATRDTVSPITRGVGAALYSMAYPSFIALMGVLALLATVLTKRGHRVGRPLLWTSAIAMLLVGFIDIFGIGLVALLASVLLLVAAFGLKRGELRGRV